jgi:hypothetical protein
LVPPLPLVPEAPEEDDVPLAPEPLLAPAGWPLVPVAPVAPESVPLVPPVAPVAPVMPLVPFAPLPEVTVPLEWQKKSAPQ